VHLGNPHLCRVLEELAIKGRRRVRWLAERDGAGRCAFLHASPQVSCLSRMQCHRIAVALKRVCPVFPTRQKQQNIRGSGRRIPPCRALALSVPNAREDGRRTRERIRNGASRSVSSSCAATKEREQGTHFKESEKEAPACAAPVRPRLPDDNNGGFGRSYSRKRRHRPRVPGHSQRAASTSR
jgi:hypothetical protein